MIVSNAKTWTILLIFCIIPKCAFSAAAGDRDMIPKTLYQVLVVNFPQIQNTTLRHTLDDVFSSQCINWTAIEHAKPIYKDKDYVPCILFYESAASFLKSIGDKLVLYKSLVDNVISSNHTLQDVCLGNKSFSSNFSVLSTKKDFSDYLKPTICILSCIDESKSTDSSNQFNQPTDICKAAYFFATFDVSKFITNSELLIKKPDHQSNQENKEPFLKNSENLAPAPEDESKTQNDQLSVSVEPEAQKPKQTYVSRKNLDNIQGEQQGLTNKTNVKIVNEASVHKIEGNDKGKVSNEIEKTEVSVENGPVVSGTKPETLQEEKTPNSSLKDLSNVGKTPGESDNNNDRHNQEDNSLDNDSEKEEAYASGTGDELENVKPEESPKSVFLQQTESKKIPLKKPKPNTLDADEPVSSENIVDDDMDGDSYFFSYFTVLICLVIVGYVGYHNRQKVLALLLEGKRGKRNGRNTRRPNSANYHKLDSNLEEAMSSTCTKNASNVIY